MLRDCGMRDISQCVFNFYKLLCPFTVISSTVLSHDTLFRIDLCRSYLAGPSSNEGRKELTAATNTRKPWNKRIVPHLVDPDLDHITVLPESCFKFVEAISPNPDTNAVGKRRARRVRANLIILKKRRTTKLTPPPPSSTSSRMIMSIRPTTCGFHSKIHCSRSFEAKYNWLNLYIRFPFLG